MYHRRSTPVAGFLEYLIGLPNGRRNIRHRFCRIACRRSHAFKILETSILSKSDRVHEIWRPEPVVAAISARRPTNPRRKLERIAAQTAGVTPFISKLTLQVSNTTVLKSIEFAIDPKPGTVSRPLSGTYANFYLMNRGFEHPPEIILPVYGLYAGYTNIVKLTY